MYQLCVDFVFHLVMSSYNPGRHQWTLLAPDDQAVDSQASSSAKERSEREHVEKRMCSPRDPVHVLCAVVATLWACACAHGVPVLVSSPFRRVLSTIRCVAWLLAIVVLREQGGVRARQQPGARQGHLYQKSSLLVRRVRPCCNPAATLV